MPLTTWLSTSNPSAPTLSPWQLLAKTHSCASNTSRLPLLHSLCSAVMLPELLQQANSKSNHANRTLLVSSTSSRCSTSLPPLTKMLVSHTLRLVSTSSLTRNAGLSLTLFLMVFHWTRSLPQPQKTFTLALNGGPGT